LPQYEALRLDHPLNQLVKTVKSDQELTVGDKTFTIPAGTNIHLNLAALHTHPKYWGQEGLAWNPKRFVTSQGTSIEEESLAPDTSAYFIPWAYGQRICPGKKFSQVELVAALVTLFRNHVVNPQQLPGESLTHARERLFRTGMDVNHQGTILFEMAEPTKAALVWSRREK
jgi:cytochrome P450